VATDYFTKWVEAIPIMNVTSGNMINFVKEHIVYRFGIPQTITTNQGSQFTLGDFEEDQVVEFISLLCSSERTRRGSKQWDHQIDQMQD
jgi:hypothetical protein